MSNCNEDFEICVSKISIKVTLLYFELICISRLFQANCYLRLFMIWFHLECFTIYKAVWNASDWQFIFAVIAYHFFWRCVSFYHETFSIRASHLMTHFPGYCPIDNKLFNLRKRCVVIWFHFMLNKNMLLVLQYPKVQRIKSFKWFCTALFRFKADYDTRRLQKLQFALSWK